VLRSGWLATALTVVLYWIAPSHLLAKIEVQSAGGISINIASPARRVVSLAPHATELIAAAGGQHALVAITQACDYPRNVLHLPRVASYSGVNMESLLAVKPDLVVAWPGGNRPQDIAKIRERGIPVYESSPRTVADVAHDIESLGILMGTAHDARHATSTLRQNNSTSDRSTSQKQTRVFYQLGAGALYTLNNQHPLMELLNRCGGENIFAHLSQLAPQVSIEAVLAAKPEIVFLASPMHHLETAEFWRKHGAIPVIVVDGARLHRPTPRMIDAAQEMCKALSFATKK
jgi:iron complex transport system substrate-binding protein